MPSTRARKRRKKSKKQSKKKSKSSKSTTTSTTSSTTTPKSRKKTTTTTATATARPTTHWYDPNIGSQVQFDDEINIIATVPPGFFEDVGVLSIYQTNVYDTLFDDTALVYGPIHKLPHMFQVEIQSRPAAKKYALFDVLVPPDFTSLLSGNESLGVFLQIDQSSNNSGVFPVFALISAEYDDESKKLQFWLPSYAFRTSDNSIYEATVAVATTRGPGSDMSAGGRRLLSSQTTSRCDAVSIRCPLGVQGQCDDDKVTSPFSMSRTIVHEGVEVTRPHFGVDYRAQEGDPIYAAADGFIEFSSFVSGANNTKSFGETIVLRHSDGSATLYSHLSSRLVEVGMSVSRGSRIGFVGHTGFATGPHLHLEYVPSGAIFSSKFRIDPHPCTKAVSKGSISVGDSGSLADDAFEIFIDNNLLGKTDIGSTNNLAVNYILPGKHSLTLFAYIAPDDKATFHVELFDGLAFDDGSTTKDYSSFGTSYVPQGGSISFNITVPQNQQHQDFACTDGNISKGQCMFPSSSCDRQQQLLLPAQTGECKENDGAPQCCFFTPKCFHIGGKCMPTSECSSSSFSVPLKCPGPPNVQCCIPKNTCETIGGICRNTCDINEISSIGSCPDHSYSCCSPSRTCVGTGDFMFIEGHCSSKTTCSGDFIPGGRSAMCEIGTSDVECCIPSPSCSFFTLQGSFHTTGKCRTACFTSETAFHPLAPKNCGVCCAIDPAPPEVSVSKAIEELTFESSLIEDRLILDDVLRVKHQVNLKVDCVSVSGQVHPKLVSSTSKEVLNEYHNSRIFLVKSELLNDNHELFVTLSGQAWDGQEKIWGDYSLGSLLDDIGNHLNVLGIQGDIYGVLKAKDVSKFISAQKGLNAAQKGLAYFLKNVNAVGEMSGYINGLNTLGWLVREVFEVRMWWLYSRVAVFRCQQSPSDSGSFNVESYEIEGPLGVYPMTEVITGRDGGSDHRTKHTSDAKVQPYILPTKENLGVTSVQNFAISTVLKRHTFFSEKVMEHDEFVISLRCKKDDGQIIHVGAMGPFVRKTADSTWDIFDPDAPARQLPSAVVHFSKNSNHSIFVHSQGYGVNEDTDAFGLGISAFGLLQSLTMYVVRPIIIVSGIAGTFTAGTTLTITLSALLVGMFIGYLVREMNANYAFGYSRSTHFECQKDSSGSYYVYRYKEKGICFSFETRESGDAEDYYLQIDYGNDLDMDGFAKKYEYVIEPKFRIQADDCEMNDLIDDPNIV